MSWNILYTHTIAPLSPTTYGTVTICILALEGTKGLVSKINETPIKKDFSSILYLMHFLL